MLLVGTAAQAEFTLGAPPREGAGAAAGIYNPLAIELSNILGEPVRFVAAENWFLSYDKLLEDNLWGWHRKETSAK